MWSSHRSPTTNVWTIDSLINQKKKRAKKARMKGRSTRLKWTPTVGNVCQFTSNSPWCCQHRINMISVCWWLQQLLAAAWSHAFVEDADTQLDINCILRRVEWMDGCSTACRIYHDMAFDGGNRERQRHRAHPRRATLAARKKTSRCPLYRCAGWNGNSAAVNRDVFSRDDAYAF